MEQDTPFGFAWSLAAEEQFYLTFGVLIRWCPRPLLAGLLTGLVLVKPLCPYSAGFVEPLTASTLVYRILFSYRVPILMGVLAAIALHTERGLQAFRRWVSPARLYVAMAIAFAILFVDLPARDRDTPLTYVLFALMTYMVAGAAVEPL